MKRSISVLLFVFAISYCFNVFSQTIHHEIKAIININEKSIDVVDTIKIPVKYIKSIKDTLDFYLNGNFNIKSLNPAYNIVEIKENHPIKDSTEVNGKRYMIVYQKPVTKDLVIPVKYSGKVLGVIKDDPRTQARGFSEVAGIICNDGVYLCSSTIWYPYFDVKLISYNLTTIIDSQWGVISQGTRTKNVIEQNNKVIRYENPEAQDEIYLIAAKWTEYNKQAGKVLVQAVLRTPDSTMANRYLDATIKYLDTYNRLIGQYPYSKFTLVENFWQTGYGMPSFTLLGDQIIRLPFIINTSYPHELLHNYWGNSVYVDNIKGNWCEGITAYMADHLMGEQQGKGSDYRRNVLKKYTDYVNESNDFPITKFRNRNNSAEEAVGYGKSLMVYEMLRYRFGDDVFRKAFTKFYNDYKFKEASFDDIKKTFETITGQNLDQYFTQWITRTGAPTLKLQNVVVNPKESKYEITFTISQVQKEDVFNLNVPVAIYLEGDDNVLIKDINVTKRDEKITLLLDKRPVRIDVDPQFNVFRRLDRDEVPPTISQLYGKADAVIILPKSSPYLKEYEDLANQWSNIQKAQHKKLEILYDADLQQLPDKAAWIIGFENKFVANLKGFDSYKGYISKETIDYAEALKKTGGLIYAYSNPTNKEETNVFLGGNSGNMINALQRKIQHYTKYSYLGFEGDEATNKLKGEFPSLTSPLSYYIKYDGNVLQTNAKLVVRKPLIN